MPERGQFLSAGVVGRARVVCQGGGVSACELFPSRPARPGCARCIGRDPGATCGYAVTAQDAVHEGRKHRPRPTGFERWVRATLAGFVGMLVSGFISADYVGADNGFSLILPFIFGIVTGWICSRAVGVTRAWDIRALAAVFAGLSSPLAFRVNGEAFGHPGRWLPPILAAVAGALGGTYIDPRPRDEPGRRARSRAG
jgi:hypothetical protein